VANELKNQLSIAYIWFGAAAFDGGPTWHGRHADGDAKQHRTSLNRADATSKRAAAICCASMAAPGTAPAPDNTGRQVA
jgi:hypothetical protein